MDKVKLGFGLKEALDFLKIREKILSRKIKECKKCSDYRERIQMTRFEILKATVALVAGKGETDGGTR